ncbi:flagellin [Scopulibacillus daqui]|uniref:Flagellin n=1 Tax=Scopulibacillus daqui TaxID=1469162 RepID=A0ABS2PYD7_9BACL|nr:flagellin [Scopulibacillus daqui]MBM7645035.1 flagellin [Scopulibacillus daqui]
MIINHNIPALNAYRQLSINNSNTQKALERLSSGLRINRAADDAAGLANSEKTRAQIRGLEQAQRNAQDGIALLQTGDGALNETHSILQRMRELAVQSANDTNTTEDRKQIQLEVDQLVDAINDISKNTEFSSRKLFDGNFKMIFHVGANQDQNLSVQLDKMDAATLLKGTNKRVIGQAATANISVKDAFGYDRKFNNVNVLKENNVNKAVFINDGYYALDDVLAVSLPNNTHKLQAKSGAKPLVSVSKPFADGTNVTAVTDSKGGGIDISSSQDAANRAITVINDAIKTVSTQRSKIGAVQNRLEHTINTLGTSIENFTAYESRIRDADMAREMMEFTKNNILTQSAQAMLGQANQLPQSVLQLLR